MVGIVVEATETDLAVGLKELLGRSILAFYRLHITFAVYELL